MSAIEASSVGVKTMADGTLRLSVDIEPRFARDAFALFGSPGTPIALAALKTAAQETKTETKPPRRSKPIAEWLAMRCREQAFRSWVGKHYGSIVSEDLAADWCRRQCKVESRGDIDGSPEAEERFQRLIRGPWSKHCIATGVTA